MKTDIISIKNAKVHNLKNVSLDIPKNKLVVVTGPSGSGKSSLVFDTIYVEGQRRYIESLSSYARQFLGQHQPPDVESITGLSPAIAIDQKSTNKNPRSTVGTVTEIYDYLRVLFARVGKMHCPTSGLPIIQYSRSTITKTISKLPENSKIQILAPIPKENIGPQLSKLTSMGFSRVRLNKEVLRIDELDLNNIKINSFEVVIDRVVIKPNIKERIADSVEYAMNIGEGTIIVQTDNEDLFFSEHNISPATNEIFPKLEPRSFSFNSPIGACPICNGLGECKNFDKNLMIGDTNKSVIDGAIKPIAKNRAFFFQMLLNVAEQESIDINTPYCKLPKKFLTLLWDGTEKIYEYSFESDNSTYKFKKGFKGVIKWIADKYNSTDSERVKKELEEYMHITLCNECNGARLNKIALSTKVGSFNIDDFSKMSIELLSNKFSNLKLSKDDELIASKLKKEISSRLKFLIDVGLEYLSLSRPTATLSGGESQRIRLATQIGSSLSGVIYCLDEPSIGLHQKDNNKLLHTLNQLKELGNSVIVVEHDLDTIMQADHIIDIGPRAGVHGGEIIAEGTLAQIKKNTNSITAKYLLKKEAIPIPKTRRIHHEKIVLTGATYNNLNNIDVEFPLNSFVCITGVSGSGKSTLVHEVLVPAVKTSLAKEQHKIIYKRDNFKAISGISNINSIVELDQSPIGKTPLSNPATYTGLYTDIRTLFAKTPESIARGYKPGRFSFNVSGGRCEECEGNGVKKIEMHFLPDVYITCNDCKGTRYNAETLTVLYKGKNIAEVLDLTIEEALKFFNNHQSIFRKLDVLNRVGLGYIKLGQPATTLSGGEAQRLKLTRELSKITRGNCLYVLDEPTTGLHFSDIAILLDAINQLIDNGHSVIIIEHNLDIIKNADYIIDLGPGGGDKGGKIVITGNPEIVARSKESSTGQYLANHLYSPC